MIVPWTFTGVPLSKVGVKRARMAASFAAEVSIGLPDTTCAEITFPLFIDQNLNADGSLCSDLSGDWGIRRRRHADHRCHKDTG